jgi:hypothetical protein
MADPIKTALKALAGGLTLSTGERVSVERSNLRVRIALGRPGQYLFDPSTDRSFLTEGRAAALMAVEIDRQALSALTDIGRLLSDN